MKKRDLDLDSRPVDETTEHDSPRGGPPGQPDGEWKLCPTHQVLFLYQCPACQGEVLPEPA